MLPAERRRAIARLCRSRPGLRTEELVARFGVSDETIRRDLSLLERDGVLTRVHGGATSPEHRGDEPTFDRRSVLHAAAKQSMARAAVALIGVGEAVYIDVGTTALEVARALPADWRGTVVTPSVPVAVELAERSSVETLLLGGRVRPGDLSTSGEHAVAVLGEYYLDVAFLGSGGVHAEAGLTDFHPDEVELRRLALARSGKSHVLADASKHDAIAVRQVCGLDDFTSLICDQAPSGVLAQALQEAGTDIVVPSASTSTARPA